MNEAVIVSAVRTAVGRGKADGGLAGVHPVDLSATALDVIGDSAPLEGPWSRQWLWSKAASIAGGTTEVQKNIIAERLLGLPRH